MRTMILLLLIGLIGCVEHSDLARSDVSDQNVSTLLDATPVTGQIPVSLKPEPDPMFQDNTANKPANEPPQVIPEPYTGVKIYGDANTCNPCRNLHADLRFLQENHGWTVSENETEPADWQFLPPGPDVRQIPLIEFWENGQCVRSSVGYSTAQEPEMRRDALKELCRQHPRKLAAERKKLKAVEPKNTST